MTPRNKDKHGKADRKLKCFRLPGRLIALLRKESNQTAAVIAALDRFYEVEKDV